jgi:hypothetical protein
MMTFRALTASCLPQSELQTQFAAIQPVILKLLASELLNPCAHRVLRRADFPPRFEHVVAELLGGWVLSLVEQARDPLDHVGPQVGVQDHNRFVEKADRLSSQVLGDRHSPTSSAAHQ